MPRGPCGCERMRKFAWLVGLAVIIALGVTGYVGFRFLQQEAFKNEHFDRYPPQLPELDGKIRILLFSKTNGIREASIEAAVAAIENLAGTHGWAVYSTENGAVHDSGLLEQFDVIIWNNVTGDVLLPGQRSALQLWIERGGRFFGIHASGGNRNYAWDWRPHYLIGARFKGHTLFPEVRAGTIEVENPLHPIVQGLPEKWNWQEEWYSFHDNPRDAGAQVVLKVDENSYQPFEYLQMGRDHPVLWYQAIKKGVTLYSALGHRPEAWRDENFLRLTRNTIEWLVSPKSEPLGLPPPLPEPSDRDEEGDEEEDEEDGSGPGTDEP